MSNEEHIEEVETSSLLNYVENFIKKHDNQLREREDHVPRRFDRDSVVIKTDGGNFQRTNSDNRTSDIDDVDELDLLSDPIVETQKSNDQVYQQKVYFRQYQPPTPEPIDIQVQEILLKPQIQHPPIHVHINPNKHEVRSPPPIIIKSTPPQPPLPSENKSIIYNKYVLTDYKSPPQQVIIHRHPELPPKPRPIVIEQWLPNKPAPKRITYNHVNHDELIQNEINQKHNRYIKYNKPRITIEVEIIYLPVIIIDPEEYKTKSNELLRLDNIQSSINNSNRLQCRI